MYYLYFIYSATFGKYYIGSSADPWKRLVGHNTSDRNTFTSKYRPWVLVAVFEAGKKRSDAEKMERFIKKQKSKKLIEKLIESSFQPQGVLAQLVRVPHVRD